MARFDGKREGRDTAVTYQAAALFRDRCLLGGGSLLFGDSPVWTSANLARIREKFVDAPDTSDRTFGEKFKDQIQGEAQPVVRLAAELLSVYFFFPSNVTAWRKRELVKEVLSWGGDTLPEDELASKAFAAAVARDSTRGGPTN